MSDDELDLGQAYASAHLSADGRYRYTLERRWAPAPSALFVMLNPSTADAQLDDPTIRRCRGFALALGAGGLTVVNLYAYRATNPADLWTVEDPIGPDNDDTLLTNVRGHVEAEAPVIAAWGAHGRPARVAHVLDLLGDLAGQLTALGVTSHGAPRHPLYLPAATRPAPWQARP